MDKIIKCNIRILMAQNRIDNITSLVSKSGVSRTTINKLYKESDIESLKLDTLFKLCDTLNCKLSELIEYAPSSPKLTNLSEAVKRNK